MSLATRCVACGTIFRVVQDQLKVSEGWVRCGRCDEVFNALEGLFDLDHEAPPPWSPSQPAGVGGLADGTALDESAPDTFRATHARPGESPNGTDDPYAAPHAAGDAARHRDEDPPVERFESVRRDVESDAQAEVLFASPASTQPGARLFIDEAPESASHSATHVDRGLPAGAGTGSSEPEADEARPMSYVPMPAFVARAERAAKWRQPGRLAGLTALLLLLTVMLAGQALHHFRDTVAARWPVTRAPLASWCAAVECRLVAPARIEDIVVENTGLTRAVAGTETYRLAVTLRNRGSHAIAMPWVDLTLTDNSGQLVARRALAPADFKPAAGNIATEMAPQADMPLQVMLTTGSAKVSGYTVEIFYP